MHRILLSKNLIALLIVIFVTSCKEPSSPAKDKAWADTTGTVTTVEGFEGKYAYTIEYPIPESTAINANREKITGSISQHGLEAKKPVLHQKIPMQYLKEEPIIFKLLQSMKYES